MLDSTTKSGVRIFNKTATFTIRLGGRPFFVGFDIYYSRRPGSGAVAIGVPLTRVSPGGDVGRGAWGVNDKSSTHHTPIRHSHIRHSYYRTGPSVIAFAGERSYLMIPCTIPFSSHNGYASVPLSQVQCANLARACWFASQEGLDPHLDHWRTLAALFDTLCYRWGSGAADGLLAPPMALRPELSYVQPVCRHPPDESNEPEAVQNHRPQPPQLFSLDLSAGQCAAVAGACWFAAQNSPDREVDHWLTLAVMFHVCALAGLAQWQMSPAELDALGGDSEYLIIAKVN